MDESLINEEFAAALRVARLKLAPKARPDRSPLMALGAAAFFAICALGFAASAVLAPPIDYIPAARQGVR
jgi:hypothetical protein